MLMEPKLKWHDPMADESDDTTESLLVMRKHIYGQELVEFPSRS